MTATLLALLLAAAPSASSEPTVTDVPRVADAGWSVGASIGPGAVTAALERRLAGRVWGSLSLATDMSSDTVDDTVEQPGEPSVTTDNVVSGLNAGGALRFRLQLVPDDAFLRPSLFLGAGIDVATQNREGQQADPSAPLLTFKRDSFTTTVEGDFGVLLDFTLLPWLALRASSSLVHGGYRSTTTSEQLQEEGAGTQATTTHRNGLFGGVQLQPAVGLQAFF
jgi:hypothetical protein